MGTLILALAALLLYSVICAYGFHDAFIAHRSRRGEEFEEPLLAVWHILLAGGALLVASMLIMGGMLVAFGSPHARGTWWANGATFGRVVFDILTGVISMALGLALVRITRSWLTPDSETFANRRPGVPRRLGGSHHAR